jgi:tetratricopeptide (TPR) repeat protein
MGDVSGLEELERAIEIASAALSPELARAWNNLAVSVWALGDLRRGLRLMDDAVAQAQRFGAANLLRFSRNVQLWLLFRVGRWDDALPETEEFLARCEAGEPHYHEGGMRLRRAGVRLARDDVEGALDDIRKVMTLARDAGDPQQRIPWLAGSTRVLVEAERPEEARALAQEALASSSGAFVSWASIDLALVAEEVGCSGVLSEQLDRGPQTRWAEAAVASLRGDFVRAADVLDQIGDAELEALARLRAARRLGAEGRRSEADEQLRRSLAFWRSVRATRNIRQAEAVLSDISEVSA